MLESSKVLAAPAVEGGRRWCSSQTCFTATSTAPIPVNATPVQFVPVSFSPTRNAPNNATIGKLLSHSHTQTTTHYGHLAVDPALAVADIISESLYQTSLRLTDCSRALTEKAM